MESEEGPTSKPIYTNVSKPFKMGERTVQRATELLEVVEPGKTVMVRKVLLDAETGKEINGPLDLGSHVIHPEPGGPYTIHQVVDEQPGEQREPEPKRKVEVTQEAIYKALEWACLSIGGYAKVLTDEGWERVIVYAVNSDPAPNYAYVEVVAVVGGTHFKLRGAEIVTRLRKREM